VSGLLLLRVRIRIATLLIGLSALQLRASTWLGKKIHLWAHRLLASPDPLPACWCGHAGDKHTGDLSTGVLTDCNAPGCVCVEFEIAGIRPAPKGPKP
jgi:hypothetical protein